MFRHVPILSKVEPQLINPLSRLLSNSDLEVIQAVWERYKKDRPLKANKIYHTVNTTTFEIMSYQFTRDIKIVSINPLKLFEYQKKFLYGIFCGASIKLRYDKDTLYLSPGPQNTKLPTTFLKFSHELIYRRSNSLGKYSGEGRFEVISNEDAIGRGTYGAAHHIDATIAPTEDKKVIIKIKPEGKRRIMKIQTYEDNERLFNIMREYHLSNMTNHLHPKEPTAYKNTTFMAMRLMEGKSLMDIVDDDFKGVCVLTASQRIALSIVILKAIQDQVHAYNIIHRDIDPRNIIVNQVNDCFEVKIIDYGLGEKTEDNGDPVKIASFPYIAPELRSKLLSITTQKCDIYSASRVLAELFRSKFREDAAINKQVFASRLWNEPVDGFYFGKLFDGIQDLDDTEKKGIRSILEGLGHFNPEKRWSLIRAIDAFENIGRQELNNSGPEYFS